MKFSVVIPAHNASEHLHQCLKALTEGKRLADEIIIVDDASTDDSAQIAQSYAAKVVSLRGKPHGPAFARNRGAEIAEGDILLFLDADVEVNSDTLESIEAIFETEPEIAALFGSYDNSPKAKGVISNYCNLRHHWTHQHSAREAWTFWSGCGAIRREVFQEAGGFDQNYEQPSVEDIALGRELTRADHRILLCPEVQVKHLKRWTLKSWLQTDIFKRAIPWTKMLLAEKNGLPADLNLDWKSRVSAVGAWLLVLSLLAGLANPVFWLGAPIAFAVIVICNGPLFQFFLKRGVGFAAGAVVCHCLYFLYSSAIVGALTLESKTQLPPSRLKGLALPTLLVAAFFKGLLWSLLVPPFQAPDEPQHLLYGYEIALNNTLSIKPSRMVPVDTWTLGNLVPITQGNRSKPLDFSNRAALKNQLSIIDTPTEKRVFDKRVLIAVPDFVMYHPAGYYALLAATQKPLLGQSVRWRLLMGRWLSVCLGVVVVGMSYAIAREIWPNRQSFAVLLGTLVAFQPMNAFTLASVTNDSTLILFFTWALWLGLLVIRKGMNLMRGAALGVVLTCGLLTKMSFAVMLPLILLVLLWRLSREFKVRRKLKPQWVSVIKPLTGWALALVLPALIAGPWYRERLGQGSSHLVQSTLMQKPISNSPAATMRQDAGGWESRLRWQLGGTTTVTGMAIKYVRVATSYWGNFGWANVRIPTALWISLLGATLYAVITGTWQLLAANRQPPKNELICTRRQRRALWWLALASIALVVFFALVDWRTYRTTGGQFGLSGRYYLPAIAGQMAWLMLCADSWKSRIWLTILGTTLVIFNFYCLFNVVGQRYFGTNSPLTLARLSSDLQPLSSVGTSLICLCALLSAGFLLLILRNTIQNERHDLSTPSHPVSGLAG